MKTVAYCDPFVPAEWIAAHRLLPDHIVPGAARDEHSVSLPAGMCPHAAAFADEVSRSRPAAAIYATTCDQMRRMFDMVSRRGQIPAFLMNVPSVWQRQSGMELYVSELRRLGDFLADIGSTRPSDDELAAVMSRFEESRLSERGRASEKNGGVPVAITGLHLMKSIQTVFRMVEESGGKVVLDATSSGERTQPGPFGELRYGARPLEKLARAYFGTIPDVFRRPNDGFHDWLRHKIIERGAAGLICYRYVWCDKLHIEVARLREEVGVPVLDLDAGDGSDVTVCRLRTQIEAFMEMMEQCSRHRR